MIELFWSDVAERSIYTMRTKNTLFFISTVEESASIVAEGPTLQNTRYHDLTDSGITQEHDSPQFCTRYSSSREECKVPL